MSEQATIIGPAGSFSAYVARPDATPKAAIVVIQEIFGVNRVMRDLADAQAAQGYLAICPDLFWRIEPGVDITDKSEAEWQKAFALYKAFDVDGGVDDIAATIAHARADIGGGKVGCVGYCLGGLLAFLTAARTDVDACVSYYGVGIDQKLDEATNIAKPLLLHVAEEDGFVSKQAQAAIVAKAATLPLLTTHTYPGLDHAFAREGGDHWDAEGATLANGRTRDFFARHLG